MGIGEEGGKAQRAMAICKWRSVQGAGKKVVA